MLYETFSVIFKHRGAPYRTLISARQSIQSHIFAVHHASPNRRTEYNVCLAKTLAKEPIEAQNFSPI